MNIQKKIATQFWSRNKRLLRDVFPKKGRFSSGWHIEDLPNVISYRLGNSRIGFEAFLISTDLITGRPLEQPHYLVECFEEWRDRITIDTFTVEV